MLLRKTGVLTGKPIGEPKEKKLSRDLLRQYKAAEAIAYSGYKIENNPKLEHEDKMGGIRANADPDFRIEGLVFDCYTPNPPILAYERAKQDAFNMAEITNEFDEDWCDDYWKDYINRKTKQETLESIRKHVGNKVNERQAFNVVINITDISPLISKKEIESMLVNRKIPLLEHVLLVGPKKNGLPKIEKILQEQIKGYVGTRIYSEDYWYSLYKADQLEVTEFEVNTGYFGVY